MAKPYWTSMRRKKSSAPVERQEGAGWYGNARFSSGPITVTPYPSGLSNGPARRNYTVRDNTRTQTDIVTKRESPFTTNIGEGAVHSFRVPRSEKEGLSRNEHFHAAVNAARTYAIKEKGWNTPFNGRSS